MESTEAESQLLVTSYCHRCERACAVAPAEARLFIDVTPGATAILKLPRQDRKLPKVISRHWVHPYGIPNIP